MSHKIISIPDDGSEIGTTEDGKSVRVSQLYQNHFQDNADKTNDQVLGDALMLEVYTVLTLPTISGPGWIFVTDEATGAQPCYFDGTNWRNLAKAIVS